MKRREPLAGKLWRYPIYVLACIAVLMGSYWLILLAAPRGWGGRSALQIFLFSTFVVVVPSTVSLWFGFRAIQAAQDRAAGKAVLSVLLAIIAVPLAWLATLYAHTNRMLPF